MSAILDYLTVLLQFILNGMPQRDAEVIKYRKTPKIVPAE
jgi:hypothetical protein